MAFPKKSIFIWFLMAGASVGGVSYGIDTWVKQSSKKDTKIQLVQVPPIIGLEEVKVQEDEVKNQKLEDLKDEKEVENFEEILDDNNVQHEQLLLEPKQENYDEDLIIEDENLPNNSQIVWEYIAIEGTSKVCDRLIRNGQEENFKNGCGTWADNVKEVNNDHLRREWIRGEKNSVDSKLIEWGLKKDNSTIPENNQKERTWSTFSVSCVEKSLDENIVEVSCRYFG